MDSVILFLKEGTLPKGRTMAEKICRKAPRYYLLKEQKLYKRSYSGPYLLCVHLKAVEDLLEELHEGICGNHTKGKSLSHRVLTQGYWWLACKNLPRSLLKNVINAKNIL